MQADSGLHFHVLDAITRDLSGEPNFPTALNAALLVRDALKDPEASLDKAAQAIAVEPLIASKVLRLANSAAYNRSGAAVADLRTAVGRLGFAAVRATALAVAMDQMLKSDRLQVFGELPRQAWEHSLQTAAVARVLARRLGGANPEAAMLAGMVQLIGVFYLLYRASEFPAYRKIPESAIDLIRGWQRSIGLDLLEALGMPPDIVAAVRDQQRPPAGAAAPCGLRDILYFANQLVGEPLAWLPPDAVAGAAEHPRYADLLAEAREDIDALRADLAA